MNHLNPLIQWVIDDLEKRAQPKDPKIKVNDNGLELIPVVLDESYRKKWNETSRDFYHLYKDGLKLNDKLYRTGCYDGKQQDGYSLLLKHTEDYYPDDIVKDKNKKKHLRSDWCIINQDGVEKVVSKSVFMSSSLYLLGGLLCTVDDCIKNIETGITYCKSYPKISSSEFIFVDNKYDEDVSKRGVMKINKFTGDVEIFK